MMRIAIFAVWLALCGLLTLSCGGQDAGESHEHSEAEGHVHAGEEAPGGVPDMALNGEDKWQMDSHTRKMFLSIRKSYDEMDLAAGDSGAIRSTGSKINTDIEELIKGCTMTGEAHDQLHVYLSAFIPAVEKMTHDGAKEDAEHVGVLLDLYPKYFE